MGFAAKMGREIALDGSELSNDIPVGGTPTVSESTRAKDYESPGACGHQNSS
jgi:hypothetical protein